MSVSELQAEVREFCQKRDWDQFHTPKDVAIGLSTESNELLEIFRFKNQNQQKELLRNTEKRDQVENELADILFFVLLFADSFDVDLEAALDDKIEQNRSRYPQNKYEGSNKKYNE